MNTEAYDRAGLEVVVTRIYDGVGVHNRKDPCKWCLVRCGQNMTIEEAQEKDSFNRHPGCGCRIIYTSRKGETTVRVGGGRWTNAEEYVKIEARKNIGLAVYEKSIHIPGNAGAKFRDVLVKLPDGSETRLTPNTRIDKVQTIAGMGRTRKIDEIDVLTSVFKETAESPDLWKKQKGIGFVDYEGESYKADLHWYTHPLTGRVRYKVKPDAGGNWFYDED